MASYSSPTRTVTSKGQCRGANTRSVAPTVTGKRSRSIVTIAATLAAADWPEGVELAFNNESEAAAAAVVGTAVAAGAGAWGEGGELLLLLEAKNLAATVAAQLTGGKALASGRVVAVARPEARMERSSSARAIFTLALGGSTFHDSLSTHKGGDGSLRVKQEGEGGVSGVGVFECERV